MARNTDGPIFVPMVFLVVGVGILGCLAWMVPIADCPECLGDPIDPLSELENGPSARSSQLGKRTLAMGGSYSSLSDDDQLRLWFDCIICDGHRRASLVGVILSRRDPDRSRVSFMGDEETIVIYVKEKDARWASQEIYREPD